MLPVQAQTNTESSQELTNTQPSLFASFFDEAHIWAEQIQQDADQVLIEGQGESNLAARIFFGNFRLLAHQIQWSAKADRLLAQGQVELASPAWELKAQHLVLRPEQGFLQGQQIQLHYREWNLVADQANMTEDVWQFENVTLQMARSPWKLQAQRVKLFPGTEQEILILENVSLQGLPIALPILHVPLNELKGSFAEARSPISVFQPEIGWANGGIQIGFNSELWRDSEHRLYGRVLHEPLNGLRTDLSHEWRPLSHFVLNTQAGFNQAGFQAQSEALWQSPLGVWLRPRLAWQQLRNFRNEFWLPPLQNTQELFSGLELWLASDWIYWGDVRLRYLAGSRWSTETQTSPSEHQQAASPSLRAGSTWLAALPLWQSDTDLIESSVLANGFFSQLQNHHSLDGMAGLRLLYQRDINPQLQWGSYLEYYLSNLDASTFLQPERLSPWLVGYFRYQLFEDLALGTELGISLSTGRWVQADAMVTWALRPLYLNLFVQAMPAGLKLQTRFEL